MESFGFWRHTWWGPLIHLILILTYCFPGLLQCFKLWFIFIGLWVNFRFPGSQLLLFLGFLFALMEDGIHPQLLLLFLIFRKVYGRWTFWSSLPETGFIFSPIWLIVWLIIEFMFEIFLTQNCKRISLLSSSI